MGKGVTLGNRGHKGGDDEEDLIHSWFSFHRGKIYVRV